MHQPTRLVRCMIQFPVKPVSVKSVNFIHNIHDGIIVGKGTVIGLLKYAAVLVLSLGLEFFRGSTLPQPVVLFCGHAMRYGNGAT